MTTRPSEDAIIARYLAPLAGSGALGLRDDAGLATPAPGHDLVVTKDMLVAGVHFFADDPPSAIARKALRVNLSDLAAKGASPLGFMLGLGLPANWTEPWLQAFVAGLADDAKTYSCPLIGGDTVSTPGPLTLSITAFGEVPAGLMVPRTGTQVGDHLYVTGTIGDAALGLKIRRADPHDQSWIAALDGAAADDLRARYLLPNPRTRLAPCLQEHARAAMDISDGFVGDLSKMLALEGLTAAINVADIPFSQAARAAIGLAEPLFMGALTGGDDYELLCAVAPDHCVEFERAAAEAGIVITPLGRACVGEHPVVILDGAGVTLRFDQRRFEHFPDNGHSSAG